MTKILSAAALAGLLSTGICQAGDLLRPSIEYAPAISEQVEHFGNIYTAGTAANFPAISSNWVAYSTLGGKYAYDPIDASFGFQFDGNVDYSVTRSAVTWAQITGHVTKAMSQQAKIGAFVGVDKSQAVSLGAEAMTTLSDDTWAQAQFAIIDSTQSSLIAYGVGGSLHQRLSNNFHLRGDVAYNNFPTLGLSLYGGEAALQYTFDTFPASIGVSGGYNYGAAASGARLGEYLISVKLQHSFGGPSEGIRGKLFRTNVLGLTP